MKKNEKTVLIQGLRKLSQDIADIAAALDEAPAPAPVASAPAPAKAWTYEEVRAVLAEKSRTGFRAEVKALLTAHGVKQLSDVTDPEVLAALVTEAEGIGIG